MLEKEKVFIWERIAHQWEKLTIPMNFQRNAEVYDSNHPDDIKPKISSLDNPQTRDFLKFIDVNNTISFSKEKNIEEESIIF